jgi:hypothetical protein
MIYPYTRRLRFVFLMPVGLCLLAAVGCNDQGRTVSERVRDLSVHTVTDHGITLDKNADPEQVVLVLLRAIEDDIDAGSDVEARSAAFDRELALCAPDHMYERSFRPNLPRNEAVQRVVWHWAPTLAHYEADFPKSDAEAKSRLVVKIKPASQTKANDDWADVMLELADPSGDVNASVIAKFRLVREAGYWRVAQVGFVKGKRHLSDLKS